MAMYWAFSPQLLNVWGGAMIFNDVSEPRRPPVGLHTVTEAVATRPPLPAFAFMVVMPHPVGLTNPVELTVATATILDSQTT